MPNQENDLRIWETDEFMIMTMGYSCELELLFDRDR